MSCGLGRKERQDMEKWGALGREKEVGFRGKGVRRQGLEGKGRGE